jgi:hypothetical protein
MNITFIPKKSIVYVTPDFRVLTAAADHPNWPAIEEAVRFRDGDALEKAISVRQNVQNFDNTNDIEIRGNDVYFKGDKLFGEDINRIFSYLTNGFPRKSMVKFLEAKLRNPSATSVASLYMFLENQGMPNTPNGTVLGYKGVGDDYYSINTGSEPLVWGRRDERGKIYNGIGEIIEMDRRLVCADNGQPCGAGLHIGSKDYATNWARDGRVMVVEFSPEHVVSVPTVEHEKLRVHKYRVVGELNNDYLGNTFNDSYTRPDTEPEADVDIAAEAEVFELESQNSAGIAVPRNMYNISDWSKGQSAGFKDGTGHQKRKFYEVDRGHSFKKFSKEFVVGYLAGYKDGRLGS